MRKISGLLSIAMILPIASWSASTISGQILWGVPGTTGTTPIAGAQVTLVNGAGSGATVVAVTTTDTNGSYTFTFNETGLMQVMASASGYTPNPDVALVGVNGDTSVVTNITLNSSGSANIPGTSAIGGKVTSGGNAVGSAMVTLRRRATTTSGWVLVDSTMSDSNGVYLFSNIIAAGTGTTANAYSLVITAAGNANFTSGNLTVADGQVLVSNAALTAVALQNPVSGNKHILRFKNTGDRLILDLGLSMESRTVSIFSLNGTLQNRVSVPVGESQIAFSSRFSPSNGYLFQVK